MALRSLRCSQRVIFFAGMNDICSPIIILIENEADCYWCFDRAMRRMVRQT